jgi:hypothetical protein
MRCERPTSRKSCSARAQLGTGAAGVTPGRDQHVLQRRERRHQVVELEHEAERAAAAARQPVVVEVRGRLARDQDLARGRPIEQAHDVEQRALARARRADERAELAARDQQVHAVQHARLHLGAKLAGDAGDLQDGLSHSG